MDEDVPTKPTVSQNYISTGNDLSAVKESELEESKVTVEDLRQRLDQEFSIKKSSQVDQTPKIREKSPSFYDVDESLISKRDAIVSLYSNSVTDTQPKASESTRKPETKLDKINNRVEPLNLQRDVDLMISDSERHS